MKLEAFQWVVRMGIYGVRPLRPNKLRLYAVGIVMRCCRGYRDALFPSHPRRNVSMGFTRIARRDGM